MIDPDLRLGAHVAKTGHTGTGTITSIDTHNASIQVHWAATHSLTSEPPDALYVLRDDLRSFAVHLAITSPLWTAVTRAQATPTLRELAAALLREIATDLERGADHHVAHVANIRVGDMTTTAHRPSAA